MTATSATQPRVLGGRYELRALIGEGTFGRVYRGHDRRLDRAVAVKVIKPWWSEDGEWAQRFEREAQLMARVSHPGIVQVHDIGYDQGSLYYVAELVDGESLADRLARGRLDPSHARGLAAQLCRALAAAHAQRVVHRDIKPENVLIDRSGRVKVGDFGIARLAEASSDGVAGTVLGTPKYMAPEQARGAVPTPATDIYGAGVVLYEMLAGEPPFVERSAVELALAHLSEPPPPLPADTPPALAEIASRALAKQPGERWTSARQMADALERADLSHGRRRPAATRVGARLAPRANFHPVERRRHFAILTVVVGLLVGMALAAILTATSFVRVPDMQGLTRTGAFGRARAHELRVIFSSRHSQAPVGSVIAQRPGPGDRVGDGSTISAVLSAGPPPVVVPLLVGDRSTDAVAILARQRLLPAVTQVPAPGLTPGLVVTQSPSATKQVAPGTRVNLSVAETPRWREVTSFSGEGSAQSVPFRIRGERWRVIYSMSYDGTCGFLGLFCSGPSAQVTHTDNAEGVSQFSLGEGGDQTQAFNSGPGVYEINVASGSDNASWSIRVQDDY